MTKAFRKRPLYHIRYDSLLPEAAEIIHADPDNDLSASDREAKRRRVEHVACQYLRGGELFISTAKLKGPFPSTWVNPYGMRQSTQVSKDNSLSNELDLEDEIISSVDEEANSPGREGRLGKEEHMCDQEAGLQGGQRQKSGISLIDAEILARSKCKCLPARHLFTIYLMFCSSLLHNATTKSLYHIIPLRLNPMSWDFQLTCLLAKSQPNFEDHVDADKRLAQARHGEKRACPEEFTNDADKESSGTMRVSLHLGRLSPGPPSSVRTYEWLRQQSTINITPEPEESISSQDFHPTPSKPPKLALSRTSLPQITSALRANSSFKEHNDVFLKPKSCGTARTSVSPNALPQSLQVKLGSSILVASRPRRNSPTRDSNRTEAQTLAADHQLIARASRLTAVNIIHPVIHRVTDIANHATAAKAEPRHPFTASPALASKSPGFPFRRVPGKKQWRRPTRQRLATDQCAEIGNDCLGDIRSTEGDDAEDRVSRDRSLSQSSVPEIELEQDIDEQPVHHFEEEPEEPPVLKSKVNPSIFKPTICDTVLFIKKDAQGNWPCPVQDCPTKHTTRTMNSLREHVKQKHTSRCTSVKSRANLVLPFLPQPAPAQLTCVTAVDVVDDVEYGSDVGEENDNGFVHRVTPQPRPEGYSPRTRGFMPPHTDDLPSIGHAPSPKARIRAPIHQAAPKVVHHLDVRSTPNILVRDTPAAREPAFRKHTTRPSSSHLTNNTPPSGAQVRTHKMTDLKRVRSTTRDNRGLPEQMMYYNGGWESYNPDGTPIVPTTPQDDQVARSSKPIVENQGADELAPGEAAKSQQTIHELESRVPIEAEIFSPKRFDWDGEADPFPGQAEFIQT
jgi:hypothetical protein